MRGSSELSCEIETTDSSWAGCRSEKGFAQLRRCAAPEKGVGFGAAALYAVPPRWMPAHARCGLHSRRCAVEPLRRAACERGVLVRSHAVAPLRCCAAALLLAHVLSHAVAYTVALLTAPSQVSSTDRSFNCWGAPDFKVRALRNLELRGWGLGMMGRTNHGASVV